ncbi:MAG: AIPR family protein [Acidimicrobiia bacterium]
MAIDESVADFFHSFRQELLATVEVNGVFEAQGFMELIADDLLGAGELEGFEYCYFGARRGMRVDGYWFDDEDELCLLVADFESRQTLQSLTATEVAAHFRRLSNFFEGCAWDRLYEDLELTSPEYDLARQISDRLKQIHKVRMYLFSERVLSERVQQLPSEQAAGRTVSYHVWDVGRLHRLRSSESKKETLEIDLLERFRAGLPCLRVPVAAESYESYLVVVPGTVLADVYGQYGSRLLEQNVRTYLQERGKVNRGIRDTLDKDPEMFFAYNNGITATAESVVTQSNDNSLEITTIRDLQIVNGAQTTASLFHARRKHKVSLEDVFVQMKLSVIKAENSEGIVSRISEYANTQNRVSAADFFSNHPFHITMEEFSRRLWAPAVEGSQRETKWFYERVRGQYADATSSLTPSEKKKFQLEYPKQQVFSKTDLAKFENVWDDHPRWPNLGAQKNFARFADRISQEWRKNPDQFNAEYFRRVVARGIIFRATERLISRQSWYSGGYRANIVAYTLALLGAAAKKSGAILSYSTIWDNQGISEGFEAALEVCALEAVAVITNPPAGIANVTEWCKREGCWDRINARAANAARSLPRKLS